MLYQLSYTGVGAESIGAARGVKGRREGASAEFFERQRRTGSLTGLPRRGSGLTRLLANEANDEVVAEGAQVVVDKTGGGGGVEVHGVEEPGDPEG